MRSWFEDIIFWRLLLFSDGAHATCFKDKLHRDVKKPEAARAGYFIVVGTNAGKRIASILKREL